MAEKRKISDVNSENISQRGAKRFPRITRSGVFTVYLRQCYELSSERSTYFGYDQYAIIVSPKNPLLPKEQPGDKEASVLSNVERIFDCMVNEAVITLFISEVTAILPSEHSFIKQSLTTPQAIKRAKKKRKKPSLVEVNQVLMGDGESQEVIGISRNLQLPVGQSNLVSANALCFDVGYK
ncbi:hypothetical protein [Parasitella parasitica]|uniref:Uncharacterized protein n=1 Tax=Parasitella parasitica TaxID=35722 RepID=A0A0B7NFU4_9FUNG|nr:hypothetical protein [Parasitella parasitica]